MSSGRLSSKTTITVDEFADRLWVLKLDGMHEAVTRFRKASAASKKWNGHRENVGAEMVRGNCGLTPIVEAADLLVDEALLIDPRLARKSSWRRCEPDEGIQGDAALIAEGEERCCLQRFKTRTSDSASVEPVRIVISTDTKHVTDDHAKAFIAAAKIAQQFRPLEIWWQGAWLIEEGANKGHGFVFHVPLLNGDLDFARIQFVLSHKLRDAVSYQIKRSFAHHGVKPGIRIGTGGGVAGWSHLPNTHHFVPESGIQCDPDSVARVAAQWAGFEPAYAEKVFGSETLQRWSPGDGQPYVATPLTAAQIADRDRWQREREAATRLAARQRHTEVE